jgi:hypothetical protein
MVWKNRQYWHMRNIYHNLLIRVHMNHRNPSLNLAQSSCDQLFHLSHWIQISSCVSKQTLQQVSSISYEFCFSWAMSFDFVYNVCLFSLVPERPDILGLVNTRQMQTASFLTSASEAQWNLKRFIKPASHTFSADLAFYGTRRFQAASLTPIPSFGARCKSSYFHFL